MDCCTINHGHQSGCIIHHESQQDLDEQLEELAGQQGFKI